jgi:hypothetical protein
VIVSIDPGVRFTGVAIWDHHQSRYYLRRAHLVKNTAKDLAMSVVNVSCGTFIGNYPFEAVIVELPQVYTRDKSKGDPNDLIAVAAVAGAIMDRYASLARVGHKLYVLPGEWKGGVPKTTKSGQNPIKNRCQVDLRPQELGNIALPTAMSLQHNVWDAVGIGLWYLKKNKLRSASPERSMVRLTERHVN